MITWVLIFGVVLICLAIFTSAIGKTWRVYVAYDEGAQVGGIGKILGVYRDKKQAKARIYEYIKENGSAQFYTCVVVCTVIGTEQIEEVN